MYKPIILGFYGYSNTGKTNLITKITSYYNKKQIKIATLKQTNKDYNIDTEGKDTYRYAQSGSECVVFTTSNDTVFFIKNQFNIKYIINQLMNLEKYDLILIEGAKDHWINKIRLGNHPLRNNTLFTYDGDFKKIVSLIDEKINERNDKMSSNIELKINGEKIPLTEFPEEFIINTIIGMVKSLKGVDEIDELELYFKK
jgi:molybdopterin-guanine dinucleotide biosynthesis protein B